MKIVAFLAGCLIAAPLCALERDGLTITLTAAEDAECDAGGGCLVIPLAVVEGIVRQKMQEAYDEGKADERASCRNRI